MEEGIIAQEEVTQVPFTKKLYQQMYNRYRTDPISFAKEMFTETFERFDPWQIELLEAILDPKQKYIDVPSCHSSGKTLLGSLIAVFIVLFYEEARIQVTSATKSQLMNAFGVTIESIIERSSLKNWFDVTATKIKPYGRKGSFILLKPWSKANQESWAGTHCTTPVFIIDEASAVPIEIFDSISGSMMHPNSMQLLLGNPIKKVGKLHEAATKDKKFKTIHVSAYDSSFIDPDWIEEMADTYGRDSDTFRVRVLGQFPKRDSDIYIPVELITEAYGRPAKVPNIMRSAVVAALDPADNKDKKILTLRIGKTVEFQRELECSITQLYSTVKQHLDAYDLDYLIIDGNGVGAQCFREFKEDEKYGSITHKVKFSKRKLEDDEEYADYRTRWFGLGKKWLTQGGTFKDKTFMDITAKELGFFLYTTDDQGRFQAESKKMARRRGMEHSPDHGDSFLYTFATPRTDDQIISSKVELLENAGKADSGESYDYYDYDCDQDLANYI